MKATHPETILNSPLPIEPKELNYQSSSRTEKDLLFSLPNQSHFNSSLNNINPKSEDGKSLEKTLSDINISIVTDISNANSSKAKESLFPKIINEAKIIKDAIFVNTSFDTKEKRKRKQEKCIKKIIFFLLIFAMCSLMYIVVRDLKFCSRED